MGYWYFKICIQLLFRYDIRGNEILDRSMNEGITNRLQRMCGYERLCRYARPRIIWKLCWSQIDEPTVVPLTRLAMIRYPDGTEVKLGDRVEYDGLTAFVEVIIDSKTDMSDWGVESRGIMLTESTKYGRVFQSLEDPEWETIVVFQERALEITKT